MTQIDGPHPIDLQVGARLMLRRKERGLTQAQLGAALGITFQQIQKYENATNRISASRLYDAAARLDTPVSYFFDQSSDVGDTLLAAPGAARVLALWRDLPERSRKAVLGLMTELTGTGAGAKRVA